jgi:hypothetical protein
MLYDSLSNVACQTPIPKVEHRYDYMMLIDGIYSFSYPLKSHPFHARYPKKHVENSAMSAASLYVSAFAHLDDLTVLRMQKASVDRSPGCFA